MLDGQWLVLGGSHSMGTADGSKVGDLNSNHHFFVMLIKVSSLKTNALLWSSYKDMLKEIGAWVPESALIVWN